VVSLFIHPSVCDVGVIFKSIYMNTSLGSLPPCWKIHQSAPWESSWYSWWNKRGMGKLAVSLKQNKLKI